jgi:hypothetical protein
MGKLLVDALRMAASQAYHRQKFSYRAYLVIYRDSAVILLYHPNRELLIWFKIEIIQLTIDDSS